MAFTQTPPPPRQRMRKGPNPIPIGDSASALRQRLHVPPPATAEDRKEREAQQTARVEGLMVRGVSEVHQLSALLGMTEKEVNRQIKVVYARWGVLGSDRDMSRLRGKSLARLEALVQTSWSMLSSDNKDMRQSDKIALIRAIAELEDKRASLSGLTPKVVERLAMITDTGTGIQGALAQQDSLKTTAERFLEILAERRAAAGMKTIEHDEPEDYEADAERR